jgi:hypothetical protein
MEKIIEKEKIVVIPSYGISEHGWIPKVKEHISRKESCRIELSGNEAMLVIANITQSISWIPWDHATYAN